MNRATVIVLAGCVLLPAPRSLTAQDSQFGVRGLGTPGQFATVRARATGGAFALFDPLAPAGEGALGELEVLTATAVMAPSWRRLDFGAAEGSATATRFTLAGVAAPIPVRDRPRWVLSAGFTTYLDRTYKIGNSRDDSIRGAPVTIYDTISSDGAVADLRVAAAYRASRRLSFGVGVHRLVGSTRTAIHRTFSDTLLLTYVDSNDVGYEGFGVSAGALLEVTPGLRLAVSLRTDGSLQSETREGLTARSDLPATVAGAVQWAPSSKFRMALAGTFRSWSVADAAAQVNGGRAFDTFQWNLGAEVGAARPLRFGLRRGNLPFSPTGDQPTEWAVAVGTARPLSKGRGVFDMALERAIREGPGLTERVWTLMVGVTIRP